MRGFRARTMSTHGAGPEMSDDLPPRRHPADPPWWHWGYVNVRGWARTRRRGPFVFGSIVAAGYIALQLGIRQLELRWGHDPGPVWATIFGGIFFGTFFTLLLWSSTERRYHRALERRAEYDAELERPGPAHSVVTSSST